MTGGADSDTESGDRGDEARTLGLARQRALVQLLEIDVSIREERLAKMRSEGKIGATAARKSLISTPAAAGIVTALVTGGLGLAGGALVNALQARASASLERQKFESSLVLKAIETGSQEAAAKNLAFLVQLGFIADPNGRIKALEAHPQSTPVLPAAGEAGLKLRGASMLSPETVASIIATLKSFREYMARIGAPVPGGDVTLSVEPTSEIAKTNMLAYYKDGTMHLDERLAGDLDSVLHEFSHRVLLGERDLDDPNLMALEYGFTTYLPCTFRERSVFGRDMPGTIPGSRPIDLAVPRIVKAGYGIGTMWDGENDWASTLWAIRTAFGKEMTDAAFISA